VWFDLPVWPSDPSATRGRRNAAVMALTYRAHRIDFVPECWPCLAGTAQSNVGIGYDES
jgi:hypothetical protein